MSKSSEIISPISIDLGARNTGVYFANYKAGATIDEIEKEGKVYKLEKDKYTLLMEKRTANRHQKRGYDRRQMVKRLFKLIWCKEFNLEWDDNIQQVVGFLFNRRGFNFLTADYDSEVLKKFPKEIFENTDVPEGLKNQLENIAEENNGFYDFTPAIEELSHDSEKLGKIIEQIKKPTKDIKKRLLVIGRIKKLKEFCKNKLKSPDKQIEEKDKDKVKLSETPEWVLEEWRKEDLKGLDFKSMEQNNAGKNINIVKHLNELSCDKLKTILSSIPDVLREKKELKASLWNFSIKNFSLEKADFTKEKTHLHHLSFALDKIKNELDSGARHRSKYFEEIKLDLDKEYTDKDPKYLKDFCDKLRSKKYKTKDGQILGVDELCNLIGHLGNFELKILRSYFNDQKFEERDFWDKEKLEKRFKHWILNIWRVNPEKNKKKAEGQDYDYKKLRKEIQGAQDIIKFFLKEDPNRTIPPYQDNNNRHPPKCQSLILNINYLDKHYKGWEQWAEKLKNASEDYLRASNGKSYEDELKELKSGKQKGYFERGDIKGEFKKVSQKRHIKHLNARVM